MVQQSKILRSTLMILGISFLSFCGSHQVGSAGGAYITPASIIKPVVAEPVLPVPPAAKTDIIVFTTLNKFSGDLIKAAGGTRTDARAAADSLCEMARTSEMDDRKIRALISINAADQIADMPTHFELPTNKPFIGDLGVQIAVDFADLLDSALEANLGSALSGVEADEKFWTGSTSEGLVDVDTCSEWRSETVLGTTGLSTALDANWMKNTGEDCASTLKLICVAF